MSAKAFLECCFPTLHQRYQAKDRLGLKIHNFLPSPEQCLTIQNTETKIFRWASPWDYHRDLPRLGTKVRLSGVSRQQLTTYEAYSILKAAPGLSDQPNLWARCTLVKESLALHDVIERVTELNRKGPLVAYKDEIYPIPAIKNQRFDREMYGA